ncbi:MAG: glycoside hydrolase family 95-like protein [Bacteroidales bacterium]
MKRLFLNLLTLSLLFASSCSFPSGPAGVNNLKFHELAKSWDEGLPLGNGWLGALVWQKGDRVRFSLDRADLWDLRPVPELSLPEWNFKWVMQKWLEKDYGKVQELFDYRAYDNAVTPTKIPGAALEFSWNGSGGKANTELNLADATGNVDWPDGVKLQVFVHATKPVGYFHFTGIPEEFALKLVPPVYQDEKSAGNIDVVGGQDLRRLGYVQGKVTEMPGKLVYRQEGSLGFYYVVSVEWKKMGTNLTGTWSVTSSLSDQKGQPDASALTASAPGYSKALIGHKKWWRDFWAKSDLSVPDTLLQKQWYMEQYKFGSAARADAPPISLQAVWTADNGKLPPWKGDFHNDLNTQLSYWPAYSSNHLDLEEGYLNWLWEIKPVAEKYTRAYFCVEGLNVPGVATLQGEPMGGWIQYSFGPTVSAWLSQHFYLHWRYSQDRKFLEDRAYPYLTSVARFLDGFSVRDSGGQRKLPLSSSPEIHDNSPEAWFSQTTNFDIGMIRFVFSKAAELALELNQQEDAAKWTRILNEWPGLASDSTGLNFAPGEPYRESHRHFSHLVGWHPLGVIDWSDGKAQQLVISNTLRTLEKYGPDWWCGYSYSWAGNLYARAFDGERAAGALKDFAACFTLPNSFHVNGDQTKSGKSKFIYRPFTLEGNFAFASGLQEMLIQSHTGIIRVFPAIPASWKKVSFKNLRTEGAFLVSATMTGGVVSKIEVHAEKDGTCRLGDPENPGKVIENEMKAGGVMVWSHKVY